MNLNALALKNTIGIEYKHLTIQYPWSSRKNQIKFYDHFRLLRRSMKNFYKTRSYKNSPFMSYYKAMNTTFAFSTELNTWKIF